MPEIQGQPDGSTIPSTKQRSSRIGFFDLSAEIRNDIYSNIVESFHWPPHMSATTSSTCRNDHLYIDAITSAAHKTISFKPGMKTCTSLVSLSLVSKQFAAELRPIYFGSWERIKLVNSRGGRPSGPTWMTGEWEEELQVGDGAQFNKLLLNLGSDARFVRTFEMIECTALGWPAPSAEKIAERIRPWTKDLIKEGWKVHVTLTFGADMREYETRTWRFDGKEGGELLFVGGGESMWERMRMEGRSSL